MSSLLHLPQPLALLPGGNHGYQFLGEPRRVYAHPLCLHATNIIEHLLYASSAVNAKHPVLVELTFWWAETENEPQENGTRGPREGSGGRSRRARRAAGRARALTPSETSHCGAPSINRLFILKAHTGCCAENGLLEGSATSGNRAGSGGHSGAGGWEQASLFPPVACSTSPLGPSAETERRICSRRITRSTPHSTPAF